MNTSASRPAWQMPPGLPQAVDDGWAYQVDDDAIAYGPGPWPFYATSGSSWLTRPRFAHLAGPALCAVRLAPDIAFYAWRTEYLLLCPTPDQGLVEGSCYLVTPTDPGGLLVSFRMRLLDNRWTPGGASPVGDEFDQQILGEKVHRAAALLHRACAERDTGVRRPVTAADIHAQRHAEGTGR